MQANRLGEDFNAEGAER